MKRFARWLVDDFTVGWWCSAAWFTWRWSWTTLVVTVAIMLAASLVQAWAER